jgi:hypothetical protein
MKKLIVVLALMSAAACSSVPDAGGGGQSMAGFTEEPMSGGRYRIAYAAQDEATANVVSDRVLVRAAQATLDAGNEWFEIQSKVDGKLSGRNTQTLIIVMGSGESLAGGPKQYDAKQTLASLRDRIS